MRRDDFIALIKTFGISLFVYGALGAGTGLVGGIILAAIFHLLR